MKDYAALLPCRARRSSASGRRHQLLSVVRRRRCGNRCDTGAPIRFAAVCALSAPAPGRREADGEAENDTDRVRIHSATFGAAKRYAHGWHTHRNVTTVDNTAVMSVANDRKYLKMLTVRAARCAQPLRWSVTLNSGRYRHCRRGRAPALLRIRPSGPPTTTMKLPPRRTERRRPQYGWSDSKGESRGIQKLCRSFRPFAGACISVRFWFRPESSALDARPMAPPAEI
jgi:hypothetical protein